VTTPLLQGQQRQLNDGKDACTLTMAKNAIAMRATIAIAMTAKTPAHRWQQRLYNKGNNTITARATTPP
jgi:hypothetical protein